MQFALPLGLPRGLSLDCGPSEAEDPWTDRSGDERGSVVQQQQKKKAAEDFWVFKNMSWHVNVAAVL